MIGMEIDAEMDIENRNETGEKMEKEREKGIGTETETGTEPELEAGTEPGTEPETETGTNPGDSDGDTTGEASEQGREQNTGGKARPTRKIISRLLIAAGMLLILVPFAISYFNEKRNSDIIDQFLAEAQMAALNSEWIVDEPIEPVLPNASAAPTASEAPVTNKSPEPAGNAEPATTPDPGAQTAAAEPQPPAPTKKPLMSAEEIQRRMTGVIMIEKIDLRMVIMDGVDDETLRVAAGRMPETGNFDEVGNVVLAGHRSYTFGKYFNRLDELESGDEIIVQTRTKKLKYIVYDKKVIEPDDFSILKGNGKDKILTLFTCTPVVIADHRLVIHAKQVE